MKGTISQSFPYLFVGARERERDVIQEGDLENQHPIDLEISNRLILYCWTPESYIGSDRVLR
jgi:hypothetical protein